VYTLSCRDDAVLLVQRSKQESLMPGMWELPECRGQVRDACLNLRHSITVTDYTVSVVARKVAAGPRGKWIKKSRVSRLPLTGLARKILRAVSII
jgi:hypothetical protein